MKQDSEVSAAGATRTRARVRTILVALVVLVGAGAAVYWLTLPLKVTVADVTRGTAVQAVYATGTVEASVTIRVAPQVAGRLLELKADEGQKVKAGEELARLDDTDLRAALGELEARLKYAEQHLERADSLFRRGWATRDRLDQARTETDAARQAVRRVTAQLSFMALKTPADGTIIRRDGEVGDYLPVNQPVFYIAKEGLPLRITADVDEEDIPLVKIGQKVLIRSDAFPSQVFTGEVAEITPKGDPIARNYRVRVHLPADTALLIGMTTEINIVALERHNAMMVPTTAVSGTTVWAVREGRAVPQTVQVGVRNRERVEILSGLSHGDKVIIDPPANLSAGKAVRVTPAPPPAASATSAFGAGGSR